MLNRIVHIWNRIEAILIGSLILASLAIFLGGAVVRALAPAYAVDWAEEVSLYCIIWATVFSGSSLVSEGRHINTTVFLTFFDERWVRMIAWLVGFVVMGFIAVMFYQGYKAYDFALMLDERSASTLRTPQGYAVFLALPVGMALMFARALIMVLQKRPPFAEDHDPLTGGLD